uniref:Uncharacterized protein n=1 Tax=Anopheles coluzzii TaxID=1518534 RepID=A0A8W7P4D6_ANOCL
LRWTIRATSVSPTRVTTASRSSTRTEASCARSARGVRATPSSRDSRALRSCRTATSWCAIGKTIVCSCSRFL